jgi:predicted O-methyltransferase YrrM
MSFLVEFDRKYANKLGKRAHTFRKTFELLEMNAHKYSKKFYHILETGCVRSKNSFDGDGMSTVLFDAFVNYYDGMVMSIDINEEHCKLARSLVSKKTQVICADSVKYLWRVVEGNFIDLVYLDSYDIDFNNPHPSALHHMKEFCAISGQLSDGTLVAVDDQKNENSGKGMYIARFMEDVGYKRFIDDYQIGWIIEY